MLTIAQNLLKQKFWLREIAFSKVDTSSNLKVFLYLETDNNVDDCIKSFEAKLLFTKHSFSTELMQTHLENIFRTWKLIIILAIAQNFVKQWLRDTVFNRVDTNST